MDPHIKGDPDPGSVNVADPSVFSKHRRFILKKDEQLPTGGWFIFQNTEVLFENKINNYIMEVVYLSKHRRFV